MKISENVHGFLWQSMTANNANSYFIDGTKRILIDPGHAAHFSHVESGLRELGLSVEDIDVVLCTHAHPDHVEGVRFLKDAGAKFGLHEADWDLVKKMAAHMGMGGEDALSRIQPDFFLQSGTLNIGDVQMEVFHTPGHSPGSLCYLIPDGKVLITGDLVFKDGVGRTDLPGGDLNLLTKSISEVAELTADCVLPGHGEIITDAESVKMNYQRIGRVYLDFM